MWVVGLTNAPLPPYGNPGFRSRVGSVGQGGQGYEHSRRNKGLHRWEFDERAFRADGDDDGCDDGGGGDEAGVDYLALWTKIFSELEMEVFHLGCCADQPLHALT